MKDHYFWALSGRRYSFLPVWVLGICFCLSSCMSVKAYQKMYLNDAEMELAAKKCETFETNFEAYREGAQGANGGKVGGGCGCN